MNNIKYWDDNIVESCVGHEVNVMKMYFLSKGKKKIKYIDIGANTGKYYDVLIKNNFEIEKVIMVEPARALFNYLVEKFKNIPNSFIYDYAISDYNGDGKLNVWNLEYDTENIENKPLNSINLGLSKLSDNGQDVKLISGYNFLRLMGDDFDFIKIDTENRDYNILSSINDYIKSLKNKPYIIYEHNYHNDISYDGAKFIYEKFVSECDYDGLPFDNLHSSVYLTPKK